MRTDPDLMSTPATATNRVGTSECSMSSSDLEALSVTLRASVATHSHAAKQRHLQFSQLSPDAKFHLRMALLVGLLLAISIAGCILTSIHVEIGARIVATFTLLAMLAPLPIYLHEKGRPAMRESVLVIPWELIVTVSLPYAVLVAARCRMPLQDTLLAHIDEAMRVSVPAIMAWADHHWLGTAINATYPLILPLLVTAALVPPFAGKLKESREFLLANLIAIAVGLPLFALFPAVAPWYHYHLVPPYAQAVCWDTLRELRLPGPYIYHGQAAGVVCFPSFHVMWAVLSAAALWGFRPLRIPVALLSALIILSTLTTGWHYFADVVAGILIAALALAIAKVYSA